MSDAKWSERATYQDVGRAVEYFKRVTGYPGAFTVRWDKVGRTDSAYYRWYVSFGDEEPMKPGRPVIAGHAWLGGNDGYKTMPEAMMHAVMEAVDKAEARKSKAEQAAMF